MSEGAERTPSSARSRRPGRPSGDDREQAIRATLERLLGQKPLGAISVDDLARGAGISRPSFYFYFPSKDAVLLALLDRVVTEADATMTRVFEGGRPTEARDAWEQVLHGFHETFRAHRALTLAAAEARSASPEVRALWAEVFERWVQRCAGAIEAERSRGAAPPGLSARDLAIALTSMNERVIHASLSGDGPAVADHDVVPVLLRVWLAAVYGSAAG
jgi:TetR/AcrR family transcriptional regulator, ethionamide resistance regulator